MTPFLRPYVGWLLRLGSAALDSRTPFTGSNAGPAGWAGRGSTFGGHMGAILLAAAGFGQRGPL